MKTKSVFWLAVLVAALVAVLSLDGGLLAFQSPISPLPTPVATESPWYVQETPTPTATGSPWYVRETPTPTAPGPGPAELPEPATALLLGGGLAALAAYRRRGRRRG